MQIYKYQIGLNRRPGISMPRGAKILHLALQHDEPHIWAMVDPAADHEERQFAVWGTGHEIDTAGLTYVGTWQKDGFVWHLFERGT